MGDLLNDLSFASVLPLDFSVLFFARQTALTLIEVAFTMFDTLVVPCQSSFGLGGHVADRLLPLLGPNFGSCLQSELDNRFAGEQPKGAQRRCLLHYSFLCPFYLVVKIQTSL